MTTLSKSKSRRNLKKLTISAPLMPASPTSPISPIRTRISQPNTPLVVVLVSKYRFEAVESGELSIGPKEYLKLVERPGNGWIRVQKLDKYDSMGYIPASYVDIEVNDVLNPISLEWLNERTDRKENKMSFQALSPVQIPNWDDRKKREDEKEALSAEEPQAEDSFHVLSTRIDQVLQSRSGIFWYQIWFGFPAKSIYVGKCYQDLFHLHCKLLKKHPGKTLPKLPAPSSHHSLGVKSDLKLLQELDVRRKELETYMISMISMAEVAQSEELRDFVEKGTNYQCGCTELPSIEKIVEKLSPGSTNLTLKLHFSAKDPLPMADGDVLQSWSDSANKYPSYSYEDNNIIQSKSDNTLNSYTSLIAGYDSEEDTAQTESESVFSRMRTSRGRNSDEVEISQSPEKTMKSPLDRPFDDRRSVSTLSTEKFHSVQSTPVLNSERDTEMDEILSERTPKLCELLNETRNDELSPKNDEIFNENTVDDILSESRVDEILAECRAVPTESTTTSKSVQNSPRQSSTVSSPRQSSPASIPADGTRFSFSNRSSPINIRKRSQGSPVINEELDDDFHFTSPEPKFDGFTPLTPPTAKVDTFAPLTPPRTKVAIPPFTPPQLKLDRFGSNSPTQKFQPTFSTSSPISKFQPVFSSSPNSKSQAVFSPEHKFSCGSANTTPGMDDRKKKDMVKIKFLLNNEEGDIVVLRLKRTNVISISYLKKLLSYKIYKDPNLMAHVNLKRPGAPVEEEDVLMACIRKADKMVLEIETGSNIL